MPGDVQGRSRSRIVCTAGAIVHRTPHASWLVCAWCVFDPRLVRGSYVFGVWLPPATGVPTAGMGEAAAHRFA